MSNQPRRGTPTGAGSSFMRTFWHGGAAGRKVGDFLIPGTQVPGYRRVLQSMSEADRAEYRPDFAYVTTDRDLAFDYALQLLLLGPVALYRVTPEDPTHDPDYPQGVSFRCSRAQIVAIEPDRFSSTTRDTGAARRYITWDDGSRMYDDAGYALPNKLHQHLGMTPAHLRSLGFEAPFHLIERMCSETIRRLHPRITQAELWNLRKELTQD